MAAARKQKQAQKLQEQQISKALAESPSSTKHFTFDDDEDLDIGSGAVASGSTIDQDLKETQSQDGSDDEDDDAPIEVVSNKVSRKQASQESAKQKAQAKAEKAERQAAEKKRAEKPKKKAEAPAKQIELEAAQEEEDVEAEDNGAEESEGEEAAASSRLDPSLFAEVFAQPAAAPRSILKRRSAEQEADEVAKLQRERKQRRKAQRAGGVIKGNDGLPMKRTKDGVVLRALSSSSGSSSAHKTNFDDDEDQPEEPLDVVVRPERLDRSTSLPNGKARAFLKRSLAKRGTPKTNASAQGTGKKGKSEDDPLGLNDPAFLPGGEFYHLVNKADKTKAVKHDAKTAPASARQAYRGGGVRKDAVSVLRARSRGGPSLGFARSQQDSDDDY